MRMTKEKNRNVGPCGKEHQLGDFEPEKEKLLKELHNLALKEENEGETKEGQKKLKELLKKIDEQEMGDLCNVNQIRLFFNL